jgi:phosphoglycerate dehydrogenase-like enzyme
MSDKEILKVFISTPLEPEYVERIRAVDPARLEVVFEPDLLPATRYVADHKGVDGFALTAEQEVLWRGHLADADVLWDFPPASSDGTDGLAFAANLKWIQTTSSGVGQRVQRLGLVDSDVLITTARGVHAAPLTEFVFLTLLSHVKRLRHLQEEQRKHGWERFCGSELEGKTLAVIGAGGVGRRVAAVGKSFGMRVVALARPGSKRTAAQIGIDAVFPWERLHEMLSASDALVLSVPHTHETEGLLDEAAFAALKPGAVFVNVARGQVVEERCLIEALRSGRIAFAGLDVFAVEPLPKTSPLWEMPNVLVSPHSASTAASENEKITDVFCFNLRCYLDGRVADMKNVFDKVRLY